ncbi:MAG: hypothetical protein QG599_1458 [Pseudomonadota bacterium]|nr:hypothetical protein [Pseudomonadota bacterium]
MNRFLKLLIPALWSAFFFSGFPAVSESAEQKTGNVPYITQLLAVSNGRVIAVTMEKGGLYLATPDRRKLQRLLRAPETYIHQATQDANGVLYLATRDGIYRTDQPDGLWERVTPDAAAWLAFNVEGSQGRVKRWGEGLFMVPSAHLSVEKALEAKAMVAQQEALRKQAAQLRQELEAVRDAKTPEGTKAFLEKFAQRKKLLEAADNLQAEGEWRKVSVGLPKAPAQTLAILPDGEEFAGFFGWGIYRSRNAGTDWEAASTGLFSPWVLTLAVSARGDLYAGTFGSGLFRWQADVAEWTPVNVIFQGAVIQDLAFGANGQILAGSQERGLFLSLDEGRTWRQPGASLPGTRIQGVAVGSDGAFWVSVWGRSLYVSTDQGVSWRPQSFPQATQVTDLVFTPDGVGYAVSAGSGLHYSTDGGRQWMAMAMPEQGISHKVRLAVTGDGRLWLGSAQTGLWTLAGPNASWERGSAGLSGAGIRDFAVSPASAVLAIARDDGGLYEHSASGDWQPLAMTLLEENAPWSVNRVWKPVTDVDVGASLWRELGLDRLEYLPDGRWVAIGYYEILLSEGHGAVWRRHRFGTSFHDFLSAADGTLYTERFMVTLAQRRDSTDWDAPVTPREAYRFFRPAGPGRWVAAREEGGMDILSGDGVSLQVTQRELAGEKVLSLAVSPEGTIFAGLENELKALEKDRHEWRTVDLE